MARVTHPIWVSAALLTIVALCGCGGGSGSSGGQSPQPTPTSTALIAFSSNRGSTGTYQIYLMNSDGSNQHALTTTLPYTSAEMTSLSPKLSDGSSWVAFDSWNANSGTSFISVVNCSGTNNVKQLTSGADDEYPSWSPDGTKIAFVRQNLTTGIYSLYAIDMTNPAAPGSPVKVIDVTGGAGNNGNVAATNLCWMGGSRYLAFSMRQAPAAIITIPGPIISMPSIRRMPPP